MNTMRAAACLLILLLAAVPQLRAQDAPATNDRPAVEASELEAAVLDHEREIEADRRAVREVLADPQVQEMVRERGVDPDRLDEAVEGMDRAELERIAPLMEELEARMQNRATVTISAGALLLALILVLLLS